MAALVAGGVSVGVGCGTGVGTAVLVLAGVWLGAGMPELQALKMNPRTRRTMVMVFLDMTPPTFAHTRS